MARLSASSSRLSALPDLDRWRRRPFAGRRREQPDIPTRTKVLNRYVKRTQKQIIDGTIKRRANRPAPAENNQLDLFGWRKGGREIEAERPRK